MKHKLVTHENGCPYTDDLYYEQCPICDGGLAVCEVCNGAEGSLPSECPGRKLSACEEEEIMLRNIDYKNGKWISLK